MIDNMPEKTGKSLDEWSTLDSKIDDHVYRLFGVEDSARDRVEQLLHAEVG